MFYLLKFIFVIEKGRLSAEGSGSYGGKIQMAKILSIEAEASQIRVAEVEVRGKKGRIYNCFCIPAPQGAVEDGQIRDTKTLGENLKAELSQRKIRTKKVYFATGSTRIASREVRIPFVKANRIQSIIEANATDYFPIDVSKYVLSYSVVDVESRSLGTGWMRMRLWMCFAAENVSILSLTWSLLTKKSLMRRESWKLPGLR